MTPTIKRILLPTRFSLLSRRAAEYVKLLVSTLDAEIHVVHVVAHTELIIDPGLAGTSMSMPVPGPGPKELLAESDRKLGEFVAEVLAGHEARVKSFSMIGGITDELVSYASTRQIDLVVMGTHADGMLKRLVFGSVGKGVLESAVCPVLLVPVRDAPR